MKTLIAILFLVATVTVGWAYDGWEEGECYEWSFPESVTLTSMSVPAVLYVYNGKTYEMLHLPGKVFKDRKYIMCFTKTPRGAK